ncbi:methyl-accepting chemotaxis protein [Bacillus salitolerans]|uniref:Methyl-accepting chemotaxis protein n=1 Tax=Bacillus salitolerans TaxID=1437434 RepID=A0ABW4LK73_9BACI
MEKLYYNELSIILIKGANTQNMKSLQTKMLLFFSILFIISSTLLGYFIYSSSISLAVQSVSNQAEKITQHALSTIDIEKYQSIDPTGQPNEYYYELRERLTTIKETNGLKYLYTMGRRTKEDSYEYFYVVDGAPLDYEDVSELGAIEENDFPLIIETFERGEAHIGELDYTDEYGALISAYLPIKNSENKVIGIIGGDFDASNIYELISKERLKVSIFIVINLLIIIVIIYVLSKQMVRPLKELQQKVKQVQTGDFTVQLNSLKKDEIGHTTRAVSTMIQQLKQMVKGITLSSKQVTQFSKELFNNTMETAASTETILHTVHELSKGTTKQKELNEEVSSKMNEISLDIDHITSSIKSVSRSYDEASQLSITGKHHIQTAISQMKNIESAQHASTVVMKELDLKINDINHFVSFITEIANQTNLLALNAAIEAARAGEQGKGFAVVSEEVRKLADQSGKAAETIKQLLFDLKEKATLSIQTIEHGTNEIHAGCVSVTKTGNTIEQAMESIQKITAQMSVVERATTQITQNKLHIMSLMEEVNTITKQAFDSVNEFTSDITNQSAMVQQINVGAEELRSMSEELLEGVKSFKVE